LSAIFRQGAARELLLPIGKYRLTPFMGGSPGTAFYRPLAAPPIQVSVDERSAEAGADLILHGGVARVSAIDRQGRQVRGFDLRVQGDSLYGVTPWHEAWDTPDLSALGDAPSLILPPGSYTVFINHPGVGTGSTTLDIADGTDAEVRVELDASGGLDLRAHKREVRESLKEGGLPR
jgi:hypothetical protein